MNDLEMYEMLCRKSQNIKMKMLPGDVAAIARRFKELSDGRHGEWMYVREVSPTIYLQEHICKACFTCIYVEGNDYRFCPYCGAKMK